MNNSLNSIPYNAPRAAAVWVLLVCCLHFVHHLYVWFMLTSGNPPHIADARSLH
jgi:hypothetical protein